MEVRIPLTIFKVAYQVAEERPYTELDRLVLEAITKGAQKVEDLKAIFQLPERLLIECLVELIKAGYVALKVSGEGGFMPTSLLTKQREEGIEPLQTRFESETVTLLREDLTSLLITNRECSYRTGDSDKEIPRIIDNMRISHGTVAKMFRLMLKKNSKYLCHIEEISLIRRAYLSVDVTEQEVVGLPDAWRPYLKDMILEQVTKQSSSSRHQEKDLAEYYLTNFSEEDLLLTQNQHIAEFKKAMTTAKTHLLVVSAHLELSSLESLQEQLLEVLKRQVQVDLIWGYPPKQNDNTQYEKKLEKWLSQLRKNLGKDAEFLNINLNAADTDAKLLIYDTEHGYRACLGSYNWLFQPIDKGDDIFGKDVSLCLNHLGLIAEICHSVVGWLNNTDDRQSTLRLRWQKIAQEIERQTTKTGENVSVGNYKIRMIDNDGHRGLLWDALYTATQRCLVASHKINRIAIGDGKDQEGNLGVLKRRSFPKDCKFIVQHGKPLNAHLVENHQTDLRELVENQAKGTLEYKPEQHCKVLIADNYAIISSYNFLSVTGKNAKHVGVRIEGTRDNGIVDKLWEKLTT